MQNKRLKPIEDLLFVKTGGSLRLISSEITLQDAGSKTLGMLSIPRCWTLPYFAVSADLLDEYRAEKNNRRSLVNRWAAMIADAAASLDISSSSKVLIRSSALTEDIEARGKFHTREGSITNMSDTLQAFLGEISNDGELANERIPLLVQKKCMPLHAKGHLSNERRCYKEGRDWLGEFETGNPDTASSFQINLRHWREKAKFDVSSPLLCRVSARISEILKGPAAWAHQSGARVHFEWVWDGSKVYLVQADEEDHDGSCSPIVDYRRCKYQTGEFAPKCLRLINEDDAKQFAKIANVFTYLRLQLPTAKLYILNDPELITCLSNEEIPSGLRDDLAELIKWSVVIRTDISCETLEDKQLLPTLADPRSPDIALKWMIERCKKFIEFGKPAAFILHNFIPALSSAYALAEPDERMVQIEALWGLPQGLYYNPTDKAVVDTLAVEFELNNSPKFNEFDVQLKSCYKNNYLSVTETGAWELRRIAPPLDWKNSITKEQCQKIALESRRIAISEGRPVSVMWFVDVPDVVAGSDVVPWYHEQFDLTQSRSSQIFGKRNPFDKIYVIKTALDVERLFGSPQNIPAFSRVKIQPSDEKLLRDKDTLKKIGTKAKAQDVTIVLEGAILSHAYYQLVNTGARIEVLHPFVGFDEKLTFNKLVRDFIPNSIVKRGERVFTARIKDETLIRALKEKLVEEACEVLDAKDLSSIVEEIADVKEVLDGLIHHLKIAEKEVATQQRKKRDKRGGFVDGIVLLQTQTTLPSASKSVDLDQPVLQGMEHTSDNAWITGDSEANRRKQTLDTRTDRRVLNGSVELIAGTTTPIFNKEVILDTNPETRSIGAGTSVRGKVRGRRRGGNWFFELIVSIEETQPSLPLGTPLT